MAARDTPASQKTALSDGLEQPQRRWAVLTLMAGLAITVLDSSIANVALPTIARDLGIEPAAVIWVVIVYSLAVVMSLLPFSAVAERIGFPRMFALGITVFMLASLACAVSTSLAGLVSARIAQGLGGSMLMCLSGGLVRNIYPARHLGFGLSLNAMMVGVMSVLGPSIGAFILAIASWPWIFAINVPIGLLTYFGVRFLPDMPRTKTPFDWVACGLSIPVFGLSIVGLDAIVKDPLMAIGCLLVAALAAVILVRRSRGQTAPLVPIDLLRIRPVSFAVGASAFSFAAQMSAFVALPFYFLNIMGHSYVEVGLLLGAWSIGVATMAPVAGVMSGRFSVAVLCAIGALTMAAGLLWVIVLPVAIDLSWIMAAMLLGGIGFGFFQTPNNRALLLGAPRIRSGAAGGLQATTRVFGQSFGTALVAVAFNIGAGHGAVLGVIAAILCAMAAFGINIARYLHPARDIEP